ncbi:DUF1653 domain-containing protein [Desulfovibrio cuneatus]|uniref:DUF1653 domain-containing protein n=1 Tax=Desulfovibrio cuneatus TaxID=159728 RepID=UPI00040C84B7|nr:DUF1653 domain-containing protein [Desulfovibrio cuneatus]
MSYIILGGLYQHYKGNHYRVLHLARHSETEEPLVVYQPLYGQCGIWVRPLPMFLENVFLSGKEVPRFAYVAPAPQAFGTTLEIGLSPALAALLGTPGAYLWAKVCQAFPPGAVEATPAKEGTHARLHCAGVPAALVTVALHQQVLAMGVPTFGVQVMAGNGAEAEGPPLRQRVVMLPGPAGHEVGVGIEISGTHARIELLDATQGAARAVCLLGGEQVE